MVFEQGRSSWIPLLRTELVLAFSLRRSVYKHLTPNGVKPDLQSEPLAA